MDKSWMYIAPRASVEYENGVESFLNFAFEKSSSYGRILCPCINCHSMSYYNRGEVYDHLIWWGFQNDYSKWIYHGEVGEASSSSMRTNEEGTFQHDMRGLLGDIFPTIPTETSVDMGGNEVHTDLNSDPVVGNDRKKINDLLREVEQKVYPNAKYNKLSCLVHLYHLKSLNGWSNKSFTMLLEFLKDLLPEGNSLPKTTHQVKKILAKLGLGYEKIDVCPNGCMLFWGSNLKEQLCSICGASRWKPTTNNTDEEDEEVGKQKNKAAKILRWFPLKSRLQRLFLSSKTASLMQWHHLERKKDGKLRHPADALSWNDFDMKYPEFASDPRNVRLALASDGFNPFRTMNVSYSIWPVYVIPYNLPPWYVMKQSNLILSLIIPGPKGPGNKIDVYMQPLIQELKELWDVGIQTFDVAANENFQLKAAVLSTISDFPGYANLSGWSTKGEYVCPVCTFDKSSKWLHHGRKWCYMGHRRWLQADHGWRKETDSFNGDEDLRHAPIPDSGELILNQLEHIDFLTESVETGPWKKRSLFFMLPYWKHLLLRHNLDVMHIEKNVCDNIIGTLLGQEGKSKDNMKARLDLQKMGIRKELHPKKHPQSNNMYMPKACYAMTRDEKDVFLQTLKSIKPPDEYSSNITRCVQLKERKLIGMKSYDCHMLMQEYLPIALRGTLPDHVTIVVIELCDFFRRICLKDLTEDDLQFLESRVVVTLCKLEKIFPPSFFTVMVHLVIHLVREVRLGGPVTFRWMYPIERDLLTLKSYVNNKAFPEGSIAEGYLARESLTFCSRYFSGVETLFTRPIRNDDDDDNQNEIEAVNLFRPGRPLGLHINSCLSHKRKKSSRCEINNQSLIQAHRYVLFNVESITSFREEHKSLIKGQHRSRRVPESMIEKIHCEKFSEWFKKRVERLEEQRNSRLTQEIKWLARGPNDFVRRFSGYLVKGYRFHTKNHENSLKSQNSGVVVTVMGESYPQGVVNFYGSLKDIIELNYESLTVDEIVQNQKDNRVDLDQFRTLVISWFTEEKQVEAVKKKKNRLKSDEPHVTGTKSFARLVHEETKKNNGIRPSRGMVYRISRTRKDGSIVNAKAAKVVEKLKSVTDDSSNTQELGSFDWTNDDLSKVKKGPESGSRVRCVGRVSITKEKVIQDPEVPILKAQLKHVTQGFMSFMAAVKEHIPNLDVSRVMSQLDVNIEVDDACSARDISQGKYSRSACSTSP